MSDPPKDQAPAGSNSQRVAQNVEEFFRNNVVSVDEPSGESQPALANFYKTALMLYSLGMVVLGAFYLASQLTNPQSYLDTRPPQAALPVAVEKLMPIYINTFWTMALAGMLGGALCNLRGFFEENRLRKYFRLELGMPYFIRPFSGAAAGLLIFFLASFFTAAVTIDAANLSWAYLTGRIPFVGLALLAGFASQEFLERLKEVARTTFAQKPSAKEAEPPQNPPEKQ